MKLYIILLTSLALLLSSCGKKSIGEKDNKPVATEVKDFYNYMAKRVQDQTIIPGHLMHLANPKPILNTCARQFGIKIGIIDSGVDYNNPFINNNISYHCDQGTPFGFGKDDLASDSWASPYLVRTDYLNESLSINEREKSSEIQNEYNEFYEGLTDQKLRSIITPYLLQNSRITHGTQVAALASYDDDRIGILGYRFAGDLSKGFLLAARSVLTMMRAAVNDGAKIVNLSLSFYQIEGQGSYNNVLKQAEKEFRQFIKKNKNVLFIAGTGNRSKTLDFSSKVKQFPCGINLPNVICVGSINNDLKVSSFSNEPINYKNIIYALGEDVVSVLPSKFCTELSNEYLFESAMKHRGANKKFFDYILNEVKESCDTKLEVVSGTSFATPLVSREAAKIWMSQPKLKPKQVISKLLSRSTQINISSKKKINVLLVEKASWQ